MLSDLEYLFVGDPVGSDGGLEPAEKYLTDAVVHK